MIYHKIKNYRAKKTVNVVDSTESELKEFLKYCVVNKDKSKLKEKLRETIEIRRRLLIENDGEFKDFFAFYFVDPEMVRHICGKCLELFDIDFLF